MFNLSLYKLLKEYGERKNEINADLMINRENYTSTNNTYLNLNALTFMFIMLFSMALWAWALIITVKHWKHLPDWAQIICIIGLLPVSPFSTMITIMVAYLAVK